MTLIERQKSLLSFKAMLNIITKAIVSTGNSVSQPSLHHCQKFIKLNSAHKKSTTYLKEEKKRLTSRDLSVFAAKSLFKR